MRRYPREPFGVGKLFFWAKDGSEGHSQGSPGQTAFFKEQWDFSFVDIFLKGNFILLAVFVFLLRSSVDRLVTHRTSPPAYSRKEP